jgi:exodeoxyribonuclease V alpha subunit
MNAIEETLNAVVSRVTFHNPVTGWSVLRVQPLSFGAKQETVTVHQTQVFAGATMCFKGAWVVDAKYGRQFKAREAIEKQPATTAALVKYLGSGLIKGVGPKTAKKIVDHFGEQTLHVFESEVSRLLTVPGISKKKLQGIEKAWIEHQAIREVMLFLQQHGISTLFSVKIYKAYGDQSIQKVSENPYRLAQDFYGIGFFSADKVAISIGFAPDSAERIRAAIAHVLSASREQGHCYLTAQQILQAVTDLLQLSIEECLPTYLAQMLGEQQLMVRQLSIEGRVQACYYSKSLFYDEDYVAERLLSRLAALPVDDARMNQWIERYCEKQGLTLSEQQAESVKKMVAESFAILTGGPGCGKTTTTRVLVKLLQAMHKRVVLAAPTGRAAQRMTEVIGVEAKTIHRLLEWQGGEFKANEERPLAVDFLIIDEASMLDISLTAAVLKAVPSQAQVLLIGDADQLPSVGPGNVLKDLIDSGCITVFRLTQIFRQAGDSAIVQFAHQIHQGEIPSIPSPFHQPELWQGQTDCLFIDSDEATQAQANFISQVRKLGDDRLERIGNDTAAFTFKTDEAIRSAYDTGFSIPEKFHHVDLRELLRQEGAACQLKALHKQVHPWSSLHYGLTAVDVVVKAYLEWIPKYQGQDAEVQILTPMTRGSLGSANLNQIIQQQANPPSRTKAELKIGERCLREGDRVIHRRNNYDLNVFNGDIGRIIEIDSESMSGTVCFEPEGREVVYQREALSELDLAYAITIHKSQGSEFAVVIMPVLTQHFKMLYRNLIYTGLTRAKHLAVLVGTRQALAMAVRQQEASQRQTALLDLLQ